MEMVEEEENQPKITTKRIKLEAIVENEGEDRISALPDCLLVEIVSRLDSTEEAIRTGTLSNRWKHIWTWIPVLIFKHLTYIQPWSDFVSLVDKTLAQCRQLKLKKFVLSPVYCNQSKIDSWISYAIRCNVEELDLDLVDAELGPGFELDQCFFINSCFTDLRLSGCIFDPNGAISWKNLTSLWITRVNLDVDLVESILLGSPVLETLVLEECYCYNVSRLVITSKSVKKLVLSGCHKPDNILEINVPYILSLTIKGHLGLRNLLLLNVSSLIEADLDYTNLYHWERTRKEEMLKRFIRNLSHVKELKIGLSCSKVLSRLKAKGFVVPSNIKFPGESESEIVSDSTSESENESESESESEIESESEGEGESESESESESGSDSVES